MFYLQIFLTTFLTTLILTPFIIKHFIAAGIVDKPNNRKVHTTIIPRMGGIIIYLVSIISFLIFVKDIENYRIFLVVSIIVAIIGNIDDVFGLKWSYKLFVQLTAVLFITLDLFSNIDNIQLFGFILPDFLGALIYIILFIGLLNAINFLDGLDGLLCGYSILSFTVIILLSFIIQNQSLTIISVGILGSLLGFMKFNSYPAKIFLGDTGSLSIAFIMTYIVTILSFNIPGKENSLDLTFIFLFFALPITDTLKVIATRLYNGKSPFNPDKSHLHHKILGLLVRQKITTFIIHLFTVLFVSVAIFYFYKQKLTYVLITLVIVLMVFVMPNIVKYIREYYFNNFNGVLKTVPNYVIKIFLLFFPVLSLFTVILFLFPIVNSESYFNNSELVFIILLYVVLFAISFKRRGIEEQNNNLYIFFNIIVFFVLFNLPEQNQLIDVFYITLKQKTILYLPVGLSLFLILNFVYGREKLFKQKVSLFYGQDLLLIVIMVLLFVLHSFVSYEKVNQFNSIFITAFFIYSIYLIAIKVYPKSEIFLYYLSYILPIGTIIFLIMSNS